MKIDGNNALSINFIEQKKSNTSIDKEIPLSQRTDTFVGKSMTSTTLLETNDSIGILQIAFNSISKLQDSSSELQKLNEKFSYFKSQESEISKRFEEITVEMLDIVDNTMFKDKGLFYASHKLSIGKSELSFSMINDNSIEDFTLGDDSYLEGFVNRLDNIKEEIKDIKNHLEVANFNQMAALHVNNPLLEIESNILSQGLNLSSISKDEMKQAHDINLLQDKVIHLLED